MRMFRNFAIALSVGWLAFSLQIRPALTQSRPGIRPFVNPPEGCYLVDPVEPENVYSYLRVQIHALSLAESGERANRRLKTAGIASVGKEAETITGLRSELIQDTCASFVIAYYSGSKNQTVAATAKYLASAYEELGKMSNRMLGITLQESLQRANGPSPQRQFSQLADERQAIVEKMTEALKQSLSLLIDGDRRDQQGRLDHLVLKKAQVKDLLNYLDERFPMLADEEGAPSGDFVKQAALIRTFLTAGFRPADLP